MKKIISIYREILREQAPEVSQEKRKIIEFPGHNFSITTLEKEGKILFDSIKGNNLPSKARTIMNQIKQQNFNISVKAKEMGSFELQVNNPKDYYKIIDFIQQVAGQEKKYEN